MLKDLEKEVVKVLSTHNLEYIPPIYIDSKTLTYKFDVFYKGKKVRIIGEIYNNKLCEPTLEFYGLDDMRMYYEGRFDEVATEIIALFNHNYPLIKEGAMDGEETHGHNN